MYFLIKLLIIVLIFVSLQGLSQERKTYIYDNSNRLIQVHYPTGKTISYQYDRDGNRVTQIISTVTAIDDLADSLVRGNSVLVYPNPSNGDFRTRVIVSEKQKIIVQIFTLEGKLIHEYSVIVLKGYYDINLNITPHPTGTYIIRVKGKTINSSSEAIILK